MPPQDQIPSSTTDSEESSHDTPRIPIVSIREKLIIIFLLVKVIPLILLAAIAWRALVFLGTTLRETSVRDTREALTALAVENIERLSTDTAQKVAEFLYQRDADISILAKICENLDFDDPNNLRPQAEEVFRDFGDFKTGMIRRHGDWKIADDGMSWVQVEPYIPPPETKKRSVNAENEEENDGATFHYRPPYGFGDRRSNFEPIPLYDEIAFLDINGQQIAKHVTTLSTKKRHPFPTELLDVSKTENTFVKSERYVAELSKLGNDGIYVSDVIGAYTPSHFIGMYTPDYLASRRIDAKIAELEGTTDNPGTPEQRELAWKLRVLNAELKNEEDKFNSRATLDKKVRNEIDRRLGHDATWPIKDKTLQETSAELKTLGLPELAEEILNIPFTPEEEAYAGMENPLGIRFEGIIRWAKPVLGKDGSVQGYVTFALNHDHLLDMLNHITPTPRRYTELSDAFDGNYAFVWDYNCRSVVHPRHHSICGFNPETGRPETPWLEQTLYNGMKAAGIDRVNWEDYIATLENYVPWTGDEKSLAFQSRNKKPAPELTKQGLIGLDGRYLNNAPQCTGWMNLAQDGGSGSLYILWSGLYKLNTASAIPYYTGQYSPENRGNRIGFGFVAVGAGIDDFSRPANEMGDRLEAMVGKNLRATSMNLIITTVVLSVIVILIAIWMASYLSSRLQWLINGITKFRSGQRNFRFAASHHDEFGRLAHSFDEMAENVVLSVHSPLVITDMDLHVVYANDQSLKVIGNKALADVVGKPYQEISVYEFGSVYCPIAALHRGHDTSAVLFDQRTQRFFQGTANYFTDESGQKCGYLITSTDVTEMSLKQIELERAKAEAELASRHKNDFLARMSHELRTPMNAIIGLNDITQSKLESIPDVKAREELNGFLSKLKDSSIQLLALLNDVLEVSNLESGKIELLEQPVHLREVLELLADRVRINCDEKLQEFVTDFDSLKDDSFFVDTLRLRQVLNALLNNAVKYTPTRGKIEFVVREKERKNGYALLEFLVRDNGIGISPAELERIFQPFEQAEHGGGSGLGLAIAQKLLNLFQSKITVQSEAEQGSVFSFELRFRDAQNVHVPKLEEMRDGFVGKKALVIDDVFINRIVLVGFLKEVGFIIEEAKDGLEGVRAFEKSPENYFDIVFMDIQMPNMNGHESAAAIRALPRQDAKNVPIVAVSANSFQEDMDKSLESGMDAHYAKPITREMMAMVLTTHCKRSERQLFDQL